ncbi:hypothetical protein FRC02_010082 [Tulasnella sp. 418]|nr:hypothetical protein FRC02_010082 [Tulasnella sp. 418]
MITVTRETENSDPSLVWICHHKRRTIVLSGSHLQTSNQLENPDSQHEWTRMYDCKKFNIGIAVGRRGTLGRNRPLHANLTTFSASFLLLLSNSNHSIRYVAELYRHSRSSRQPTLLLPVRLNSSLLMLTNSVHETIPHGAHGRAKFISDDLVAGWALNANWSGFKMPTSLERKLESALQSRLSRSTLRRVEEPHPSTLIDFSSNDYLSLSSDPRVRERFLQILKESESILGSGGSRLLDGNTPTHYNLERRLQSFFGAPAALLFNSGFDANVSIFTTLPQPGDFILIDELIHASVWDGIRSSRASSSIRKFKHNSIVSLKDQINSIIAANDGVRNGDNSIFVAVETLYSMDGDFAPLREIVEAVENSLPKGNGHVIVDEAHATGIYGPQGRGMVALLGLEDRVTVRLHTFGKAMGSNGAIVLASPLIRSYLCNYARPLVFSTALSHSSIISIGCSFDMLENGVAEELAEALQRVGRRFLLTLIPALRSIPPYLLSLPESLLAGSLREDSLISPIIPILTTLPRPLAASLQKRGYLARPITYPTVPKGQERVRVCMHAKNTDQEVDGLAEALITWAKEQGIAGHPEAKL